METRGKRIFINRPVQNRQFLMLTRRYSKLKTKGLSQMQSVQNLKKIILMRIFWRIRHCWQNTITWDSPKDKTCMPKKTTENCHHARLTWGKAMRRNQMLVIHKQCCLWLPVYLRLKYSHTWQRRRDPMKEAEVRVKQETDFSKQRKMENGINMVLLWSLDRVELSVPSLQRSWHEGGLCNCGLDPFQGWEKVLMYEHLAGVDKLKRGAADPD